MPAILGRERADVPAERQRADDRRCDERQHEAGDEGGEMGRYGHVMDRRASAHGMRLTTVSPGTRRGYTPTGPATIVPPSARLPSGRRSQTPPYVEHQGSRRGGLLLVLNASLSAVAENAGKRWESRAARDKRSEARVNALAGDLRAAPPVAQQASLT